MSISLREQAIFTANGLFQIANALVAVPHGVEVADEIGVLSLSLREHACDLMRSASVDASPAEARAIVATFWDAVPRIAIESVDDLSTQLGNLEK